MVRVDKGRMDSDSALKRSFRNPLRTGKLTCSCWQAPSNVSRGPKGASKKIVIGEVASVGGLVIFRAREQTAQVGLKTRHVADWPQTDMPGAAMNVYGRRSRLRIDCVAWQLGWTLPPLSLDRQRRELLPTILVSKKIPRTRAMELARARMVSRTPQQQAACWTGRVG
jgi:hypothetical protein